MSDINNERYTIQPFLDWLVDNGKEAKGTLIFSYMETYLAELAESKANVARSNKESDEACRNTPKNKPFCNCTIFYKCNACISRQAKA